MNIQAQYRAPYVIARQVVADEQIQSEIALKFGGQVKGTRLPPNERVIEFHDIDGREITAEVSDWVVDTKYGTAVYSASAFRQMFVIG